MAYIQLTSLYEVQTSPSMQDYCHSSAKGLNNPCDRHATYQYPTYWKFQNIIGHGRRVPCEITGARRLGKDWKCPISWEASSPRKVLRNNGCGHTSNSYLQLPWGRTCYYMQNRSTFLRTRDQCFIAGYNIHHMDA